MPEQTSKMMMIRNDKNDEEGDEKDWSGCLVLDQISQPNHFSSPMNRRFPMKMSQTWFF